MWTEVRSKMAREAGEGVGEGAAGRRAVGFAAAAAAAKLPRTTWTRRTASSRSRYGLADTARHKHPTQSEASSLHSKGTLKAPYDVASTISQALAPGRLL